jgi:hypothetical protein
MNFKMICATLALAAAFPLATAASAQTTTTRTTRGGGTVTSTRSVQHGVYSKQRTRTTARGNVYSEHKTQSVNAHGRVVTTVDRTGPNGKSMSRITTHGYRGNKTTVTGPSGGSRTYVRRKH